MTVYSVYRFTTYVELFRRMSLGLWVNKVCQLNATKQVLQNLDLTRYHVKTGPSIIIINMLNLKNYNKKQQQQE